MTTDNHRFHLAHVPADITVGACIGKGSNNRVFRATLASAGGEGHDVAFRVPRRGSDTQQGGSAFWERTCMLRASELGVHPHVHKAWTAKHAHKEWPSGLYTVCDMYDHDLEDVIYDEDLRADFGLRGGSDNVAQGIFRCLQTLAGESMFLFDLKASNIVLRKDSEGAIDVRILDFGTDFCEWTPPPHVGHMEEMRPRSHVISVVRQAIRDRACTSSGRPSEDEDALCAHILLAVMLVITSATISFNLYHDRREHKMSQAVRVQANPMLALTRDYVASMRGMDVRILKRVLREDAVRGVLRHYHGRRNSGTRRTLMFATDPSAC